MNEIHASQAVNLQGNLNCNLQTQGHILVVTLLFSNHQTDYILYAANPILGTWLLPKFNLKGSPVL